MSENTAVQEYQDTSTAMMVFSPQLMDSVVKMAALMASGRATIPAHLQKNEADCAAVAMQAIQWRMNPFVVAQKTHVTQGGVLGYEAQLISAVATTSGALASQPEFEFFGNWDRILGKVTEMKSEKGGKYYVAGWTPTDEEGLGVICTARLRGESEPRLIQVMLTQCYPRFSTQWATDPQQQISYAAVRKFCRRYAPAALLGVYSIDELEEVDLNPPPRSTKQTEVIVSQPETITEEQIGRIIHALPAAGMTTEDFCKMARVNVLHELQQSRFDAAMNFVNRRIEAAAAKSVQDQEAVEQ